jgi:hypothetical protein
MRLFIRSIGLLSIVAALALAAVGTAAAATATITPGGSTRGVGLTGWQLNAGSATFDCTTGSFSATLPTSVSGSLALTLTNNYQQAFSSCRTAGISYTFQCSATAVLAATAVTSSGVTPLRITSLNCTARLATGCTANVTGSLPASFSNFTSQLTVPIPGQAIAVSGSTCGSAFPNGPAVFTATGGSTFVYGVAPTTTINVV